MENIQCSGCLRAVEDGLFWLLVQPPGNSDELAWKILGLSAGGAGASDLNTLLFEQQAPNLNPILAHIELSTTSEQRFITHHGWGVNGRYGADPRTTARALLALLPGMAFLSPPRRYLLQESARYLAKEMALQDASGTYWPAAGVNAEVAERVADPSLAVTAEVLLALNAFRLEGWTFNHLPEGFYTEHPDYQTDLDQVCQEAVSWLFAQAHGMAGWGTGGVSGNETTILETAFVADALLSGGAESLADNLPILQGALGTLADFLDGLAASPDPPVAEVALAVRALAFSPGVVGASNLTLTPGSNPVEGSQVSVSFNMEGTGFFSSDRNFTLLWTGGPSAPPPVVMSAWKVTIAPAGQPNLLQVRQWVATEVPGLDSLELWLGQPGVSGAQRLGWLAYDVFTKPDLVFDLNVIVEGVTNPADINAAAALTYLMTFRNLGDAPTGLVRGWVELRDSHDGLFDVVDLQVVLPLGVRSYTFEPRRLVSSFLQFCNIGPTTVTGFIDSAEAVEESNEANNVTVRTFNIKTNQNFKLESVRLAESFEAGVYWEFQHIQFDVQVSLTDRTGNRGVLLDYNIEGMNLDRPESTFSLFTSLPFDPDSNRQVVSLSRNPLADGNWTAAVHLNRRRSVTEVDYSDNNFQVTFTVRRYGTPNLRIPAATVDPPSGGRSTWLSSSPVNFHVTIGNDGTGVWRSSDGNVAVALLLMDQADHVLARLQQGEVGPWGDGLSPVNTQTLNFSIIPNTEGFRGAGRAYRGVGTLESIAARPASPEFRVEHPLRGEAMGKSGGVLSRQKGREARTSG